MNSFQLQCMHGEGLAGPLAGNTAVVMLAPAPEAGCAPAGTTQVFVEPGESIWQVSAFSAAGAPIKFCGHGALAAARVVFDQYPEGAAQRRFASASQRWTGAVSPATTGGDAIVRLRFARPRVVACAVPDFVGACLGVSAVGAAKAGDAAGYLLLEVRDAAIVAAARPSSAAICTATRRALILTARTPSGFVLRYFAPQYGELEDAATGSAAVQLAAYWAQTQGVQTAKVTQLSKAGGQMQLTCNTTTVELSARVAYR